MIKFYPGPPPTSTRAGAMNFRMQAKVCVTEFSIADALKLYAMWFDCICLLRGMQVRACSIIRIWFERRPPFAIAQSSESRELRRW